MVQYMVFHPVFWGEVSYEGLGPLLKVGDTCVVLINVSVT